MYEYLERSIPLPDGGKATAALWTLMVQEAALAEGKPTWEGAIRQLDIHADKFDRLLAMARKAEVEMMEAMLADGKRLQTRT